jgi:hypothetical protein
MSLRYVPPRTVERFMLSDALVRVIVGPVGSGKSMGCIMEVLRRCRQQAPDASGVRRTRWALVRNTMSQLRLTVLTDMQLYLAPMVHYFVTDSTLQMRAPLADGTSIHADLVMIPLDTKADVQRLLSTQLTGAWVNELREIPVEIVTALIGRLGRFPSHMAGGPTWFGLIGDTNPWDVDSPYHEHFVIKPEPNWKLFHQPSGVGPYAENVEHLPPGYYDNLLSDRDDGWADVHVRSEWGTSNAGQAVFRRSFDAETHVRDMQTIVNPMRPVMIAMDFGRTPCALICQVDSYGRLLVFEEIVTEDIGLHQMVAEKLKPRLLAEPYLGKRLFIVADPAGRERSQLTEENAFDVLKEAGFAAYPAPTNDIAPRLLAVEKMLRQTIAGEPAVQISRSGCPTLARALASGYRYRKRANGQLEDRPDKNHPWSDVADCLQYSCMSVSADLTSRVLARLRRVAAPEPRRFTAAAWT